MTREEILIKLKHIVAENFENVTEAEISEDTNFVKDLDADSIDLTELVLNMEDAFGDDISDDDAEKIKTVKDAVDYIESHQ